MHHKWSRLAGSFAIWTLLSSIITTAAHAQPATGSLRVIVYTADADQERAFVPGAGVRVESAQPGAYLNTATTDAEGCVSFDKLAAGKYLVIVSFTGFEAAPAEVDIQAGKPESVEIKLMVARVKEEITVSAQSEQIETTQTTSNGTVQESTIRNAPNMNERTESTLPLLPGVVRGPDGLINMKGTRTSQSSVMLNSANVTDFVTGGAGMNLPIDVVSSAQVVSNPYDPEYGRMAGAVAKIDTSLSNFNKYRFQIQNITPRPKKRDGTIMGLGAFTPRMTVTGPLIRNRVAFTQSLEYRHVKTPVDTLPPLKRDSGLESFDSYSQLDLNLTEHQTASVTLAVFPQKQSYFGLNTFTPQPATPDIHQRGHLLGFAHKLVSQSGALLSSQFTYRALDVDVKAQSEDPYRLEVETKTGGFFNLQNRDTSRFELEEVYSARPIDRYGRHQLKFGIDLVRNGYDSAYTFKPVEVLRASGRLAERTEFTGGSPVSVRQKEFAAFALDKWSVFRGVTLDVGLRVDHDTVTDEGHVAPRFGFAIAPLGGTRTVMRGGLGLFFDRINLNIPTFLDLPERTITRFGTGGALLSSVHFAHRLERPYDNPRSTSWNVEIEHQVTHDLVVRTGFTQRHTLRDFYLEPSWSGDSGTLLLSNSGRSRYREFSVIGRYNLRRHVLNASYAHSNARGDLNDFNQYFGNVPNALLRPNERTRLNFDAPHRVVFWGQFEAPWKITVLPVLDVHTGFPFSVVDEERDFIGPRNRAGRFSRFSSLDMQITKAIKLPLKWRKVRAHAGVRLFNILNDYNPRDFQNITTSERYGVFLNTVDRTIRGKFVLEF